MPLLFLRIVVFRRTLFLLRVLGLIALLGAMFLPVCRDLQGQAFTGAACASASLHAVGHLLGFQPWAWMLCCTLLLNLLLCASLLLGLSEYHAKIKMVLALLTLAALMLLTVFLVLAHVQTLPGFFFWLASIALTVFPAAFFIPALEVK